MRKQQIEKGKEVIRISKDMEEEKINSYIEKNVKHGLDRFWKEKIE